MSSPYDYEPPPPPYVEPPPPATPPGGDTAPSGGGGAPGDPTVSNSSRTLISVSQAGHTATYKLVGTWNGNTSHLALWRGFRVFHSSVLYFNNRWGGGTQTSGTVYSDTPYANNQVLTADDNTWGWQTQIYTDYYGTYGAPILWFRSAAITAVASTPTITDITPTTATLNCRFYPNTYHSSATVQLQYRKSGDSTWTDAGASAATGGYPAAPGSLISRGVTGLLASTQYEVRLVITRTTVNETTCTSATATFTTAAGVPAVTTNAVTNLGSTSVQANGTLDINSATGAQVYFAYGKQNPPTDATTTPQTMTADGSFSANLTGLDSATQYWVQAVVTFSSPAGSPISGSVGTFTTDAGALTPEGYAALEDHMLIFEYDRIRKEATTVYFSVASPQAANSNTLVTTDPDTLFGAGDIKISKDGGDGADVDALTNTLMGQVTNMPQVFSLPLLAAETDAEDIWIRVTDSSGGPNFRDALIHVRTKLQLGQIVVDANEITDGHAVELTPGEDEGYGLKVNASAIGAGIYGTFAGLVMHAGNLTGKDVVTSPTVRLDTAASAQNDIYNGGVILITHADGIQARTITDYNGTTKDATLSAALNMTVAGTEAYVILPGLDVWRQASSAELTAFPGATTTFEKILQLLYQRFAFKIDQNATTQTWYESTAEGGSAIMSRSVSDDGSTQLIGQLT